MATYCFPFDNASETELDRCVGSDVFAEYLRFMVGIDHGVYNKAGRSYQVRAAGSGYAVDVEGGIAFILGRGRFDDAQTTVSLEASEGLSRIDRIVLRLNKPDRYIYLTAIKGISASDPIPPELIRNDDIYDICLAEVRIDPVYSDILPENIIDTRFDTDLCGYMPQFGEVNTDGMFDQIQAAYDRYMELLHDGIEDSVAGNLQTQIDDAAVHSGILYTTSTNHALTAAVSENSCTLRFIADAAYVKGNTLTVNGETYALTMANGKALPEGAWVKGAVVCLQLDPESKAAFFNGGGADLSFVTASAEQILAGFIGADAEGEPIEGEHRCLQGFESGMVFTGTIAAGGTVNTSVTLACGKRPKVVLTTACFKDKLTIDANANTISGIDGQVGVGITADGVAAFEGRHYDFNVRRHKAIINDTGFVIECQNLDTSQTGGYYCDWIAFY